MFRANAPKWVDAVAQCQVARSEPLTDNMPCAVVLMQSPEDV